MSTWLAESPVLLYPAIFLFLLAEGAGIPGLPYEAAFLASGYWIERGRLSFTLLVLVGTLASLAGNLIGYWIGRYPASRLARWLGLSLEEIRDSQSRAQTLLERYGTAIVILSRWFGPLRTTVTLGAGVLGMPLSRYVWASLVGDLVWTLAWQWMGWRASGWLIRRWGLAGWKGGVWVAVLGVAGTLATLLLPVWLSRRRKPRGKAQR